MPPSRFNNEFACGVKFLYTSNHILSATALYLTIVQDCEHHYHSTMLLYDT